MKCESDVEIQHECCYPEIETKPTGRTGVLSMLSQDSSISTTLHSPLHILGNEERKAVEAYKLQVELQRAMAIEYARQNTIR